LHIRRADAYNGSNLVRSYAVLLLPAVASMLFAQPKLRTEYARSGRVWAISQKPLREFWADHPEVEDDLKAWYRTVEKAEWKNWADVRSTYTKASLVGECYVFNIRSHRLIARIHPNWKKLFVCVVLTHKEYDRDRWKNDCGCNI
jgi:mRNA interferase HigB